MKNSLNKTPKPLQELNYSTKVKGTSSYEVESTRLWLVAILFYKEK
jgi:hypothetical protein